jgi:Ni,Fe-hydrogenase I large subunit
MNETIKPYEHISLDNPVLEKLQELYQPKQMDSKDANILANLAKSSIQSLETTIGSLSHLMSNLKVFKECLIDSINLQAEKTDMAIKYGRDIPQQSHILPGIVQNPVEYDLEGIRTDNDRMIEMKDQLDKVLSQKEIYLRVSEEDVRLFLGTWKKLVVQNAAIDQFMEALGKQTNPNYA